MLNRHAESLSFNLNNEILEEVYEYNYLGEVLSADTNYEKESRRRISVGWVAFGEHSQKIKSRLPLSLKEWYEGDTWVLINNLERKLRSAQRAMERRMIGVTLKEHPKSIKGKKWSWAGHVIRRTDNRGTI